MTENKFAILETTEPTETPPVGSIYYWVETENSKKVLKYKDSNGVVGYLIESNLSGTLTYNIQFANGLITKNGRSYYWAVSNSSAQGGITVLRSSKLVSIRIHLSTNPFSNTGSYLQAYPRINGVRYVNTVYEVSLNSLMTGSGQIDTTSAGKDYQNPIILNPGDHIKTETYSANLSIRPTGTIIFQIEEI